MDEWMDGNEPNGNEPNGNGGKWEDLCLVSALDGLEVRDDGIRERRLEVAPSHGAALGQHLLLGHPRAQLVHGQQVGRLGSIRVTKLQTLEGVGFAPFDRDVRVHASTNNRHASRLEGEKKKAAFTPRARLLISSVCFHLFCLKASHHHYRLTELRGNHV